MTTAVAPNPNEPQARRAVEASGLMTKTAKAQKWLWEDIPQMSKERILKATPSKTDCPKEPILSSADPLPKSSTVLYLAYGSNLAASTFLGMRKVKPVSKVNVHAPSLHLVFDAPGIPYHEPAFANVGIRKVLPPTLSKADDVHNHNKHGLKKNALGDPVWDSGLIGVAYEVTLDDWAHIRATEGGYTDILVPCIPLAPSVDASEHLAAELSRPFLVHTLYAPPPIHSPPPPGKDGVAIKPAEDMPREDRHPTAPNWARRFLEVRRRPDPAYAQASKRYLSLLSVGAAEHDLPEDYQKYLQGLRHYRTTSVRQSIGKVLVMVIFFPFVLTSIILSGRVKDKVGNQPTWFSIGMGMLMDSILRTYDFFLYPLFGDGERTQDGEEKARRQGGKSD